MSSIKEMKDDFSKGFKAFLTRNNLKVFEIAEKFGMAQPSVSCWKTARALPNFDKAVNLIEMGMTAQEMFGEKLGKEFLMNSLEAMGVNPDTIESTKKGIEDLSKEVDALKRSIDETRKSSVSGLEILKQLVEMDNEKRVLTQEQKKEILEGIEKQIEIAAK